MQFGDPLQQSDYRKLEKLGRKIIEKLESSSHSGVLHSTDQLDPRTFQNKFITSHTHVMMYSNHLI